MKKIITLTILFAMTTCFVNAKTQYSQADIDKAWNEIQANPKIINKTILELQNNPILLEQMIDEIQSNPELLEQLKKVNEKKLQNKTNEKLNQNNNITNEITLKLLNDPQLTKKILVQMGQDTKYADILSKDPEIRQELVNKINNDSEFMSDVINIIEKK